MQRILWALGLLLAGGLCYVGLAGAPGPAGAAGAPNAVLTDGSVAAVAEGFEGGALDTTQFQSAAPTCVPGGCGWTAATSDHHSGIYAAHARDLGGVTDQQLVLNNPVSIPADATSASLTFWQRYDFEHNSGNYFDGGVFEVSTNGGTTWADAGALLTTGGYNVTLNPLTVNPLHGRPAWGGTTSGAWTQVQADLMILRGSNVRFRLRLGTDDANASSPLGWWIDDLTVGYQPAGGCITSGWTTRTSYLDAVAQPAVAAYGNQVYVFGGMGTTITTAAARYDAGSNTWTPRAPLPAGRYGAAAAADGNYIYIAGGRNAAQNPSNSFYRYDATTNSYTTLTPLPTVVFQAALVALNGKIYRIGGQDNSGFLTSVDAYNIATNTWSPVAAFPLADADMAAVAYNNYIYTAGGDNNGTITAKTYRYDPMTNTWDDAAIADLPSPRTQMAAAFYGGRWLLAGGLGNATGVLASSVAWYPPSNTWSSQAQLVYPQMLSGGAVGSNFVFPAGADEQAVDTARVQVFSAAACSTTTPTPPPAATSTPGPSPTPCSITFSDVHPADYFYTPVQYLACHGVISGYGDGTFRPYANTTRAQMVKIVILGFAKTITTPPGTQYTFADVPPTFPFFAFVETAAANGIVSGYGCGGPNEPCDAQQRPYFRPYNNVTRGQLSKIVVGAAGWALQNPATASFADVAPGTAFYKFVETATCYGIVSGYGCGGPGEPCDPQQRPYFRSGNNATRGQISKIVYGAVQGPPACAPAKR